MKQVLQNRSGATVVRTVPQPPCPRGGVLVRNEYSVISAGTERARLELSQKSLVAKAMERPDLVRQVIKRAQTEGIVSTTRAVQRQLDTETPVGYSSAGVVVEVGTAVSGVNVGDRVACCGAGYANHAEIVAIPRNMIAVVPPSVPMRSAAMTTLGAIALHGIRLADVQVGHRVAVIGCGLIGQMVCRLLTAAGAAVFALDVDQARVDRALAAGADRGVTVGTSMQDLIKQWTHGVGVDVAIVTAAATSNSPLVMATHIMRDRGSVVLIGSVPIDMPRAELYDKELQFRVSRSYGPGRYDADYEERGLDYPIAYVRWTEQRNMEAVLDLQARGRLQMEDLIDHVIPVDEAARAYALLSAPADQRPSGAILLTYPATETATAPVVRVQPARTAPRLEGQLRMGLIGPGGFARRVLIPAFAAAGVRFELVGGGTGASAEAASRQLGFARVAAGEEAVTADPGVDLVVIATRHENHARLAQRALENGKHVFCEKPLALTADELERVLQAAADAPGQLMVGFNRRFAPLTLEIAHFLQPNDVPLTAAYRVSAGRIDPTNWVHDLDQGGGRAIGEACHFVDTLRFLVGKPVTQVHAIGYGEPGLPTQARDNVVVSLSFVDGSAATIIYSAAGSNQVSKERLEVFRGSRTAILDDFKSAELFSSNSKKVIGSKSQDKGHRSEVTSFLGAITSGSPAISLEEIANVSRATLAIVQSLATGEPVTV